MNCQLELLQRTTNICTESVIKSKIRGVEKLFSKRYIIIFINGLEFSMSKNQYNIFEDICSIIKYLTSVIAHLLKSAA